MPMSEKRFVFNDQTQKNSYGFRILTSGISLARFTNNPVMLDQHWNSTAAVIGKWKDWEVDGALLTGLPVFDTGIEKGAEVAGQVERDFLNSCSMGITFKHEDFEWIGEDLTLTQCELYEVSIVAVPSNANSIRLYADNGKLLSDDEVQQLRLSFIPEQQNEEIIIKQPNMAKIALAAATVLALGLDSKATEFDSAVIESAVATLAAENNKNAARVLVLESTQETAQLQAVTDYVQLQIKAGKFLATKEESLIKLGLQDFPLLKETAESIPAKVSLSVQIQNPAGTGEVKTMDDFEKLGREAKLEFKANNPDEYKKLFSNK